MNVAGEKLAQDSIRFVWFSGSCKGINLWHEISETKLMK